jgi:putative ABC transport system substrate-binding protein
MLKEISPGLTQAVLLGNPKTTPFDYFLRSAESAGQSLAIKPIAHPVENADEIERSIASATGMGNSGLVFPPDATTVSYRDLIIAAVAHARLPAVYALDHFVKAGGLMSYSADLTEPFQQAAVYVDLILRGASPTIFRSKRPLSTKRR